MALFRKTYTSFWDDQYVESLTPEAKFAYQFFLTNPLSTECGIYQITIKKMCYWSGYNGDTIYKLLKKFQEDGKIIFNKGTSEIAILNRGKYLNRAGKPVLDCIISELQKVKDKSLIASVAKNVIRSDIKAVYDSFTNRGTNRPTTSGEEKEEEKEKRKMHKDDTSTNREVGKEEVIQRVWIKTIGRNPRLPEVEETENLIQKFGEKKVERIFREAALRNIKSLQYILDNINQNTGELKPFIPSNNRASIQRKELPEL